MKINEVPEKIYVVDSTFSDYVGFNDSHDHDIEYIRTDAFIEKTLD